MPITQQRLSASLAELARGLRAAQIPYAIAGAHAAAIHGHVRATTDIDVLLRVEHQTAAERVLAGLAYQLESRSESFAHFARRPLADLPGAVERVALLIGTCELGQRALARAAQSTVAWAGLELPVVPVDILILMKLMASASDPRRDQDLADARALVRLHRAALDLTRLGRDAQEIGPEVRATLDALLADSVEETGARYRGESHARF